MNGRWQKSLQVGTALALLAGMVELTAFSDAQAATPLAGVPVTLLHTNDLHSHFRGEKTPLGLGGLARLKTAIMRNRASVKNSLLVDGGDWSEGNIYYTEGTGRETLRMMDHLGYDVAVVGNHDWINGADTLLNILEQANPSMKLVASNIQTKGYARADEFHRRIPPYVIQEVGGVKIAFIGLLTYEFIYDQFMKPIDIKEPFWIARRLSHELKKQADAVIVISHNSIKMNQAILKAAPDVDLVVGAHDHVKLTEPVVVHRLGGKPAWIVETGSWGRYLGRVDLLIHPRDPKDKDSEGSVESLSYHLEQMDSTVPENPETLARIATFEALIESKRGPIFHDHVGHSEVELSRTGQETLIGNFAADAYLASTQADLALDQSNFIYNELHRGDQTTADVFNANPGVYNPVTGKAWTLHRLPILGKNLKRVLNLLYSSKTLSQHGGVALAGAELIFNPKIMSADSTPDKLDASGGSVQDASGGSVQDASGGSVQDASGGSVQDAQIFDAFFESRLSPGQGDIQGFLFTPTAEVAERGGIGSFKIRGKELDPDRTYMLAASGGVIEALQFLARLLPSMMPMAHLEDTGIEDWRLMADHLKAHSPLSLDEVPYGRVHTLQPDLGILNDDIQWQPISRDAQGRMIARVTVRVRNTGMRSSAAGNSLGGPRVRLLLNDRGVNYALPEIHRDAAPARFLSTVAPRQWTTLTWDSVVIPETQGVFALTAMIEGNAVGPQAEANHSNDMVTRYFTLVK